MAGDGCVVQVGGAPPGRIPLILALLRYQIRLTSSSIAVVAAMVKRCETYWEARVPDREDVGVFLGTIFRGLSVHARVWGVRIGWNPKGDTLTDLNRFVSQCGGWTTLLNSSLWWEQLGGQVYSVIAGAET